MTRKKISRRDAIKLLGAATGATLLANLPSKWSAPELTSGVLPAHAQSSTLYSLTCGADGVMSINPTHIVRATGSNGASVTVFPNDPGIDLDYNISINPTAGSASLLSGLTATGTRTMGAGGYFSMDIDLGIGPSGAGHLPTDHAGSITITWTFNNPAQGSGSCSQTWTYTYPV